MENMPMYVQDIVLDKDQVKALNLVKKQPIKCKANSFHKSRNIVNWRELSDEKELNKYTIDEINANENGDIFYKLSEFGLVDRYRCTFTINDNGRRWLYNNGKKQHAFARDVFAIVIAGAALLVSFLDAIGAF